MPRNWDSLSQLNSKRLHGRITESIARILSVPSSLPTSQRMRLRLAVTSERMCASLGTAASASSARTA